MPEVNGRGFRSNGIDGLLFQSIALFGQDNDGELYVLALSGAISKLVAA